MNIDEFDDEDREFILQQLNEDINLIVKVLRKKHPDITDRDVEKLLRNYLE
jgi:hypothetical protein